MNAKKIWVLAFILIVTEAHCIWAINGIPLSERLHAYYACLKDTYDSKKRPAIIKAACKDGIVLLGIVTGLGCSIWMLKKICCGAKVQNINNQPDSSNDGTIQNIIQMSKELKPCQEYIANIDGGTLIASCQKETKKNVTIFLGFTNNDEEGCLKKLKNCATLEGLKKGLENEKYYHKIIITLRNPSHGIDHTYHGEFLENKWQYTHWQKKSIDSQWQL